MVDYFLAYLVMSHHASPLFTLVSHSWLCLIIFTMTAFSQPWLNLVDNVWLWFSMGCMLIMVIHIDFDWLWMVMVDNVLPWLYFLLTMVSYGWLRLNYSYLWLNMVDHNWSWLTLLTLVYAWFTMVGFNFVILRLTYGWL